MLENLGKFNEKHWAISIHLILVYELWALLLSDQVAVQVEKLIQVVVLEVGGLN